MQAMLSDQMQMQLDDPAVSRHPALPARSPFCHATRLNISIAMVLAVFYAFYSHPARASDVSAEDYRNEKYSLELKPLSLLLNAFPGSSGFGGEFEAKISRHIAVNAAVNHSQIRARAQAPVNSADQQNQPDAVASDVASNGLGVGMRYYGDAFASSWYVGGQGGGSTSHSTWDYANQVVEDDALSYAFAASTGYRWLWNAGLLVRVGINLQAINTTKRNVYALTSAAAADAGGSVDESSAAIASVETKVPGRGTSFTTGFDLGIGWSF